MKWFERIFRIGLFLAYLFTLIGLPFVVVWGWSGFLISLPLDGLALYWLRVRGYRSIYHRLRCEEANLAALPHIVNAIHEMARRLKIGVPQVLITQQSGLNIGCFGYGPKHSALVLTPLVLELPRDELVVLIAREMVEIQQFRASRRSWLAQFIRVVDKIIGTHRHRQNLPFRLVLKEVVIWPLTLIPVWCLKANDEDELLDRRSLGVAGVSPFVLSSAFRRLDLDNARVPMNISIDLRHLFLLPSFSNDSVVKSLFSSETLGNRIALLESLWQSSPV